MNSEESSNELEQPRFTRRTLLKAAGLLSGATFVEPFVPSAVSVPHHDFVAVPTHAHPVHPMAVPAKSAASLPDMHVMQPPREEAPPLPPECMPLVAAESFERLYTVLLHAIEQQLLHPEHGLFELTAWIHLGLIELVELETLSRGVIHGDPYSIDSLRAMLRRAPRWSIDQCRSLPELVQILDCLFEPLDPYLLMGRGLLLDQLPLEGIEGHWLERSMGFYLSKSAPIGGVLYAAELVMKEELPLAEFVETFMAAIPPVEILDFELPFGPQRWDPCILNWGYCTGIIADIGAAEMSAGDIPVVVGRVDPEVICRGFQGRITLFPRSGESFPPQQPAFGANEGLMLFVGNNRFPLNVVINGWTTASISVDFPPEAVFLFGCGEIHWRPPTALFAQRFGQMHGDCYNLLGIGPADLHFPRPLRRAFGRIAIVGATINLFLASTQPSTVADACTDVRLSWEVEVNICHGSINPPLRPLGSYKITLSDGAGLLLSDVPLQGELTVNEAVSLVYTLTVETFNGTTPCEIATATVTVNRSNQNRIFLSAPDRVFHPTRPIPVTVRLLCPAAGVLTVNLLSSDTMALPDRSVTIPAGLTEVPVMLDPPQVPVRLVMLTAEAQGYVGDQIELMIHFSNCIPASFGRSPEPYAGRWDTGPTIPGVVGVHLAVLHTGKVLLFSYDEGPDTTDLVLTSLSAVNADLAKCAIWNPASGSVREISLDRNLLCRGHCFLDDGRLFRAGGQFPAIIQGGAHRDLHLFDPLSDCWSRVQPDMAKGRWYPSCATQPNGDALVISGNDGLFGGNGIQNTLQIFDHVNEQIGPARPTFSLYHLYPFTHVVPAGQIFLHWKQTTYLYDVAVDLWTRTGWPEFSANSLGTTVSSVSRTGPGPGTSVLLPLIPHWDTGTRRATYPAGKIMILGGGGAEGEPDPKVPGEDYKDETGAPLLNLGTLAAQTAETLDLGEPRTPVQWKATGSMAQRRVMPDSVLLPDGKVLVIGGANRGRSGGFLIHFGESWGATNHANEPEIYDPETEIWETMCPGRATRLYHATAALLPDGRVVVAGHDGFLNASPFKTSQYTLDLYSPPYLFRGPRPQIINAPGRIGYGLTFTIVTDDIEAVASVALVRQSSVTHQTNTDQRFVRLVIVASSAPATLDLLAPPTAAQRRPATTCSSSSIVPVCRL